MPCKSVTGVGVIVNSGPNHLRGFLKENAKNVFGVDIAVAFVTQTGLDELILTLRKASKSGQVRLLTGLYQGITEPAALRTLLAQQNDTHGRFSVRLSRTPHFHWKAYYLLGRKKATVIVGSSNLTSDGLSRCGEINAVLYVRRTSAAFETFHRPFEQEWADASPLRKDQIKQYELAQPEARHVSKLTVSLSKILGPRRKSQSPNESQSLERKYWRDSISGVVCDETQTVIADTTNWDDRSYSWYSSQKPGHKTGDRIIIFDFSDKWILNVEVVDTCRTPKRTPDGQYFTAYEQIKGIPKKRLSSKMLRSLRQSDQIRLGRAQK